MGNSRHWFMRTAWPLLSAFFQSAMSCPICGEHCRCAEPRAYERQTITLADADEYEDTEQQFASSVAGLDRHDEEDEEQELATGSLAAARERYASLTPMTEHQPDLLSSQNISTEYSKDPEAWRDEVASRLQSYKARRRRSMGESSMSFNFESTAGNHVFLRPENEPDAEQVVAHQEAEPAASYYNHSATAPAYEPPTYESQTETMDEPTPQTQASFEEFIPAVMKPLPVFETAKLIVFPRPPMMQDAPRNQLADPVFDKPRIVEAPEAVETVAVPLADITLQPQIPDDLCTPYIDQSPELPVIVAPIAQRVFAEILDTLLVLVAVGVFATILAKLNPEVMLTDKRTTLGLLLVVPAAFWSIYKYLFLVYTGLTPGMQMAHLRLVNFDGVHPHTNPRRYRAVSMLVSIFPLGLGLLWSFVDPDTLCWHDRISRTYMTSRS
jgi:uncharacterized RDD family membrane protein YckC